MKHTPEKGKIAIKKWDFRGEKWEIGLEKLRGGSHSRKAKWCKLQPFFLKTNILEDMKG